MNETNLADLIDITETMRAYDPVAKGLLPADFAKQQGQRLAAERHAMGLRDSELATLMGIGVEHQIAMERGERVLDASILLILLNLKADVRFILSGTKDPGMKQYWELPRQERKLLALFAATPESQRQGYLEHLRSIVPEPKKRGRPVGGGKAAIKPPAKNAAPKESA